MDALDSLLAEYREKSQTEKEKGYYFEKLVRIFLLNAPVYQSQFSDVWLYADWAKEQGMDATDLGTDLVAKNKDDGTYTAIQCKFYKNTKISKDDLKNFTGEAGISRDYSRLMFVDTTEEGLGKNILKSLEKSEKPITRIGLDDLRGAKLDWDSYKKTGDVKPPEPKTLHDYQKKALEAVEKGLIKEKKDRGKLIMACGTGKTITSLRIAEKIAGKGKLVLYLVPSLALLAQTIREWANDTETGINAYATCSDDTVGKRKTAKDDLSVYAHDLSYPATTDPQALAENFRMSPDSMNIIYTTYHSIGRVGEAQKHYGLPEVDLIICDEAHRTTGAKLKEDEEETHFIKIHDNKNVKGKKRLYMTATPKIYSSAVKEKAKDKKAVLVSMDDEETYGEILYRYSFDEAVENKRLCDYKVIILAMDEKVISKSMQTRISDDEKILQLDDLSKIVGCYKALIKRHSHENLKFDPKPIQRAVAFCKTIKSSELITEQFGDIVEDYKKKVVPTEEAINAGNLGVSCELEHVDGSFNSNQRGERLDWLQGSDSEDVCRILSNAKCLSEGVDVPSLDAVIFMHPRKSQVEVVQAVGRVMRKAEGKQLGYVILPVAISPDVAPEEALQDHSKYKVIWQVLNALRSHDKSLDDKINLGGLGEDVSDKIQIYYETDSLPANLEDDPKQEGMDIGGGSAKDDSEGEKTKKKQKSLSFDFSELDKAVMDKIVKKCGTRNYWLDWATDIEKIAREYIKNIEEALKDKDSELRKEFDKFLQEVRGNLNEAITEKEVIEMLAQHLITKPVFDSIFAEANFANNNLVSIGMDGVLKKLDKYNLDVEKSQSLGNFYSDVKRQVLYLKNPEAKQKLLIEVYENFFSQAFPKLAEKLGIVYTPIEVVDFIIHSVAHIIKTELNANISDDNVHILDPFTGTGSFIVQLIESGLIDKKQLIKKYQSKKRQGSTLPTTEIHANEIILLVYYIACVNIENAYHLATGESYKPFEGICLTDTFALSTTEKKAKASENLFEDALLDNSQRRKAQESLDTIQVIIGNPPYSFKQAEEKDARIEETYAERSNGVNLTRLYDSYIRAFRWATDRIGDRGVIGFVSGSGFITKTAMDGMRECLKEEFTSLYIVNLRGDINKDIGSSGETLEGENIFGDGSKTGIAISILVKNPDAKEQGKIYYYDIGDDLSTMQKIDFLKNNNIIKDIANWEKITPDGFNDWIEIRDPAFYNYIAIGDRKNEGALFENYSRGVATSRDTWVYNASKAKLEKNMESMISYYNEKVEEYKSAPTGTKPKNFVGASDKNISWARGLLKDLGNGEKYDFKQSLIVEASYRPFTKSWLYFDKNFIEEIYQMPKIFPNPKIKNRIICLSGIGAGVFSALMTDKIADVNFISPGQCFPLTFYEPINQEEELLAKSAKGATEYEKKHGISDAGLQYFENFYNEAIDRDDIFYYIYALLHKPEYKEVPRKYNLAKDLPRIPCVKNHTDFLAYAKAGRDLADLHIEYETQKTPDYIEIDAGGRFIDMLTNEDFYVGKRMKHPTKNRIKDISCIEYNKGIKISGIPHEAYEYKISGRSAIKWVMDRQWQGKPHTESGIINNANDYALETKGNARYPLDLLLSVITVSMKTMKIVKSLPKLDI